MALSLTSRRMRRIQAKNAPQSVAEKIKHHMGEIAELFDDPKLTLVIRTASLEGDLIVSNDEAQEAITAIKRKCEEHSQQADIPLVN